MSKERIADDLAPLVRQIKGLNVDPSNARSHPQANLDALKTSLTKYGQRKPIIVQSDGMVVRAGNGLLLAAKELGWKRIAAVVVDENNTDAVGFAIMDNRSGDLSLFDDEILAKQLLALQEDDFDLSMAGFNSDELEAMLEELSPDGGEVEEDEAPEPPTSSVVEFGDLWLCGEHRVLCGDSTDAESYEQTICGKKVDLCLTDPPYWIGNTKSKKNNYVDSADTQESLIKTIASFFPAVRRVSDVIVLTPGIGNVALYPIPTWILAWFTPAGVGRGPWGFCCWQPILCYGNDPKLKNGLGCFPDALVHTEVSEKNGHPCPKPVKFWCWLMNRSSESNQSVLDPFLGSGTTLIAAEQLNRRCYGIEIEPRYVEVTLNRWRNLTGKEPTRERDGKALTEVEAEASAS